MAPRVRKTAGPSRSSHELLGQAFDQIPFAMLVVDGEGRIAMVNAHAGQVFGYERDELLGQPVETLLPVRFREGHPKFRKGFFGEPDARPMGAGRDLYALHKDGHEFPVEIGLNPIETEKGPMVLAAVVDITERKRAAESVRVSEERFRLLVDGVRDYAIFVLDPDGRVSTWNAGAERIKGYGRDEIVGRYFSCFYRKEDIEARKPERELKIAASAGRFEDENWRVRKDGSAFWANVVITALRDADDRLVGFSKITRDLTQRRQMEARFRAIIESAPTAMVMINSAGSIMLTNAETERMFGYGHQELLGQSVEVLLPQRFRAGHPGLRDRFFLHPEARRMGMGRELFGLRRDGTEFPVEIGLNPIETDEGKFVLGAIVDITGRKRLEQRFRQVVESAPSAMVMIDGAGNIAMVNAQTEQVFGYKREELLGRRVEMLLPERFRQRHPGFRNGFMAEPAARPMGAGRDLFGLRKDGREFPVEIGLNPIETDEGPMVLSAIVDITGRKNAENRQLQSQKLEALGTLAGGIAHDFNNILLAISGNTKLAVADLQPGHPAQTSLSEITTACTRAADLVRRILAFSRPQERKVEILQIRPIAEEAIKLLRATLPAMIDIRASFAPDAPAVAADASQIHQVIVNLVTNAAHAIGKNAGLIELRVDAKAVSAEFAAVSPDLREGNYCHLSVSDNGCGMDRVTLDRIFDPFFTTKAQSGGTGLGLSVVHGIVKSHDGAISVYSALGKGTMFHLYLPGVESTLGAPAAKSLDMPKGRGEHVLYVDDDHALVSLAIRTLERLGYKVTGYTNPAQALREFQSRPGDFDVVVTDLSMPGMSGFDLARGLFAARPDMPVIMTSGYLQPEDQEAARNQGILELILKPNTVEELGHALERLFRSHVSSNDAQPRH